MQVAVEHRTTYRYDRPVRLGPQVIRLRPAAHCRTPILSYSLHIGGGEALHQLAAGPGRQPHRPRRLPEPVLEFSVTVDLVADMTVINPFDFFVEDAAKAFPFTYDAQLAKELAPYLETHGGPGPLLAAGSPSTRRRASTRSTRWWRSTGASRGPVDYSVRMEPGVQDPR